MRVFKLFYIDKKHFDIPSSSFFAHSLSLNDATLLKRGLNQI